MTSGAPRAAKAGMQNPGANVLPGRIMGGGCQENKKAVVYLQGVPPSWKAGCMSLFEQRAYFSALRMVLDVPSVISARRILPCGFDTIGVWARSVCVFTRALGA